MYYESFVGLEPTRNWAQKENCAECDAELHPYKPTYACNCGRVFYRRCINRVDLDIRSLDLSIRSTKGKRKKIMKLIVTTVDCMFECLGVDCMNGCQVGPIGSMIFV